MSQQHTPEPWALREGWEGSIFYKEQTIGRCCEPQTEENARRIVACVNACAGIPTEELESFTINGFPRAIADRIQLEKQRDELLADIERCYKMLLSEPDTKGALFKAENILREAIANAKGGAA